MGLNATTTSDAYRASVAAAIQAATALRRAGLLSKTWPIAALALLCAAMVLFANAPFVGPGRGRGVWMALMLSGALCAAAALVFASGAYVAVREMQSALRVDGVVELSGLDVESVVARPGPVVALLLEVGLAMLAAFAGLMGVVACVRYGGKKREQTAGSSSS